MITHAQFLTKWKGKFVDADGSFGNQCVDLPIQYCKEVYGFAMWPVGWSAKNASLIHTFRNDPRWKVYLPGQAAKQWDILVSAPTETNPHGHIGIYDSEDKKGYNLLEQNTKWWGTKVPWNEIKVRHVSRGKPPILRFFRFIPKK